MLRIASLLLIGLGLTNPAARAQAPGGAFLTTEQWREYAGAPGRYGVAYGVPSFGIPRTYSEFSASYGPGYAYGYPHAGFVPGPYGAGLWRPGFAGPGYAYGAPAYWTFPVPYRVVPPGTAAPLGAYAPGFGPPSFFVR